MAVSPVLMLFLILSERERDSADGFPQENSTANPKHFCGFSLNTALFTCIACQKLEPEEEEIKSY